MMRTATIIYFILFSMLSSRAQDKIEVYVFVAEKCPISIYMANPLRQVIDKYADQVKLIAVFPMKNSTSQTANNFLKELQLTDFEILLDGDQQLARQYGATITPEAVVLVNKEIKYRGRISDAYRAVGKMKHGRRSNDLLYVLEALVKDRSVTFANQDAIGCFITFHALAK